MEITCKHCKRVLAHRNANTITVKGVLLPTDGVEAVILKCVCGRTRRWNIREYENEPKKSVKSVFLK